MVTHSSILVWRIPRTEEPGRATVYGVPKSQRGLSDYTLIPFLIYFFNTKNILHWGIADLKFLRF